MAATDNYIKMLSNINKMTELSCENDKLLWNEALEQAVKVLENSCDVVTAKNNIRSLKK